MAAITKFSYLKEFVEPKVWKSIDGLFFTDDSDVEKAYVKDVLHLLKINGNQPRNIHQFYEWLLYDVQSLETMGKLSTHDRQVVWNSWRFSPKKTKTGSHGMS